MIATLLFSGTNLALLGNVEDIDDFLSSADLRGDLPVYAGVNGATAARRPLSAQIRTGRLSVQGDGPAATEAAVVAAKAVLRVGQSQTVTRRKVSGTGYVDATQTAITLGISDRWFSPSGCKLLFTVETLDGPWYGASEAIAAVGTATVKGDSPTRSITATLSAAAVNPVVTNTSNGYTFRYVGTVPAGGVLVDVLRRTATALTGGTDLSSALKWSKGDPFQLDPGSQTLTTSTGTVSFTYLPAYA